MHDSDPSRPPQPPGDPDRYRMHPLLKVAIGCGAALLLVLLILTGIAIYAGRALQEQAGGAEAQEEATRTFERLAAEYPFTPPADGAVSEEDAARFFTVVDEVWLEIEPWVEELSGLEAPGGEEEEQTGWRAILSGVRQMGKLLRYRIALAEALDRQGMSVAAFLWTGETLVAAYRALSQAGTGAVPPENLALAERYADPLSELASEEQFFGKSLVLSLATMLEGVTVR